MTAKRSFDLRCSEKDILLPPPLRRTATETDGSVNKRPDHSFSCAQDRAQIFNDFDENSSLRRNGSRTRYIFDGFNRHGLLIQAAVDSLKLPVASRYLESTFARYVEIASIN